jgi:hypothetical protein
MRFGDPDEVGGGGESKAIEHILPSPPGQPAVDRLNRLPFIFSVLIDPFDCASGARSGATLSKLRPVGWRAEG